MNDIMLNDMLKDSIQQLKVPQADTRFLVQVVVVPSGDSLNRGDIKKRIDNINGYMEFRFRPLVMRHIEGGGENLDGKSLLAPHNDTFFVQYKGMMKEVLDNPHTRVRVQHNEHALSKTIQGVLNMAGISGNQLANLNQVYLTVYSWRTTPDILFDVQTIHVSSEVEKMLIGAGNHE